MSTWAEELCPSSFLSRRGGTQSCWVQYPISENQTLCISRYLWKQALPKIQPFSLCGVWQGRWKVYSPPQNDLDSKSKKKILFRFHAKEFPVWKENSTSVLDGLRFQIEKLREKLSEFLAPIDSLGVYRHLILGEKQPENLLSFYRLLGFVHVFTASGIHLYALASWVSFWMMSIGIALKLPVSAALGFSRVFVMTTWFVIWIFSGMRPGLFRPWLIVLFRHGAKWLGFRWRFWSPLVLSLCLDGFIVLFVEKSWAPGRLHYALAVGGGLTALEFGKKDFGRPKKNPFFLNFKKTFYEHLLLSFGSWLMTALWDAYEGGVVAWATPFYSLLTIQFFAVLLYPFLFLCFLIFLLGFLKISVSIGAVFGVIGIYWLEILAWAGMVTRSLWFLAPWALYAGGMFSSVLILFCFEKKNKFKILIQIGMVLLACGIRFLFVQKSPVHFGSPVDKIEQLDVGQGDATLVFQKNSVGMIDSGSKNSISEVDWIRILGRRQIDKLNWVALTHLDEDHAGGLLRLAKLIPIRCVAASVADLETQRGIKFKQELEARGVPVYPVQGGCFPFLFKEILSNYSLKKYRIGRNDKMVVFWIPLSWGWNYLSLGDASEKDELRVATWIKAQKNSFPGKIILKISHHGSRFSSAFSFLKLVAPQEAWISVGLGNSYGHPSVSLLNRLKKLNIPFRRTDEEGHLVFNLQEDTGIPHQALRHAGTLNRNP